MKIFKNIFRRKEKQEPQPLRLDGVAAAPITPKPDDAENAAAALMQHLSGDDGRRDGDRAKKQPKGSAAYYQQMAERVIAGRDIEARMARRFVSYVEEQLSGHLPAQAEQMLLTNLEQGLYDHLDTIEREGGDLKKRWQHCLADVTVRLMQAGPKLSEGNPEGTNTNTKT